MSSKAISNSVRVQPAQWGRSEESFGYGVNGIKLDWKDVAHCDVFTTICKLKCLFLGWDVMPGPMHLEARVMRKSGFSLLEVLVVLVLLVVLLSLAAPELLGFRQRHQMQSRAEHLQSSLMLARSEALRRQQRVTVCVRQDRSASESGELCDAAGTWGQGWIVFVDSNGNALREGSETVLLVQTALADFMSLKGNSTVDRYVSYGPEGRSQSKSGAFQAGTLTLCAVGQGDVWRVVINAVGKPRLEKGQRLTTSNC